MSEAEGSSIKIKGTGDGLVITLRGESWESGYGLLLAKIDEQEAFLKGARVALDIGHIILRAADMGELRSRLSDRGLTLWAVISSSPATDNAAQLLGLATRLSSPRPERVIRRLDSQVEGETAIFIRRTLRSGFKVETKGHVVVLGDVNPGAEIRSGGNVIVWGKLNGAVHAGLANEENAMVCALAFSPMQLSINEITAELPSRKGKTQPEMARIKDGAILVETWNPKKGL